MRYPSFLTDGGTIGFIAPSFGCATSPYIERFNSAEATFSKLGYKYVEGPNARASLGVGKSNTPEACAAEVNDFFTSDKCDIIMSCGGGELMCEDLSFIDFDGIAKATPKWYMGFSDNTNLTFLLPTLCDTAAIYAPCVSDFGMHPWHPAVQDAYKLLRGEKFSFSNYDLWEKGWPDREADPTAPYNVTEPYCQVIAGSAATDQGAEFEGRLIGGCMDCLVTVLGTRFDRVSEFIEKYKGDGIIWFIESCDLNAFSIRRALWQMEEAGWFKYVKGFIVGRPLHYDDNFDGFTPHDALTGILHKYNVPIIMDIDLGHLPPMVPMVSGAYASVRAFKNDFRIEMQLK